MAGNWDSADVPPGSPENGYNNDSAVDRLDYLVWAGNFGARISATAVPEPGALCLLIVGLGLALSGRGTRAAANH